MIPRVRAETGGLFSAQRRRAGHADGRAAVLVRARAAVVHQGGHRLNSACCRGTSPTRPWPTSGAREDDEALRRSGHRDVAVDGAPRCPSRTPPGRRARRRRTRGLRELRSRQPDAGRPLEHGGADGTADPSVEHCIATPQQARFSNPSRIDVHLSISAGVSSRVMSSPVWT
jgi:hypothetical protein